MSETSMTMDKMAQFRGKWHISLETYKRNGTPVRTPVWFIEEGNELFIRTSAYTGKAKRIKNNPKVRVALSNMRGSIKGELVDGSARFVDPTTAKRLVELLKKKYGLIYKLTGLLGRDTSHDVVIAVRI